MVVMEIRTTMMVEVGIGVGVAVVVLVMMQHNQPLHNHNGGIVIIFQQMPVLLGLLLP